MGHVRRTRTVGAIVACALLALGATACAESDDTSTDDDTESSVSTQPIADLLGPDNVAVGDPVKIGVVSDGATDAYDNTDELRTAQATAAYFNQHQGGIGGRPIEVVTCEAKGDPAVAVDCANMFIAEDVVAVAVPQVAQLEALWTTLHGAGVPTFLRSGVGDQYEQDTQSTFIGFNPLTSLTLPIAVAEETETKKIAFVVIDIPQAVDIIEGDGAVLLEEAGYEYEVIRVPIGTADMASQMQTVASSGAGVTQVIGNDAFCIAAFQGLAAVGYEGEITVVSQCITDATREAMPGQLEGITIMSNYAIGAVEDPTYQKYLAVMDAFGKDIKDLATTQAVGGYGVSGALFAALAGITGEITTETVAATIKAMEETPTPAGGGATFQCGGTAAPALPAVCSNQWLRTELDGDGEATTYTLENSDALFQ